MGAGTIALAAAWLFAAWHLKTVITFRLSTATIFFASLLFIHGVPLLTYLYLSGPGTVIYDAALAHLDTDVILQRVQLAVATMFFCITLGSATAGALFPTWRRQYVAVRSDSVVRPTAYRANSLGLLAILALVLILAAVAIVQSQFGKVLSYYGTTLSGEQRAAIRFSTGGSSIYIYNVFVYSVGTYIATVAYVIWRYRARSISIGALVACLCCLLMLAKLNTLSKAPPVTFVLQFILLGMILAGRTMSLRIVLWTVFAAVLLFAIIVKLTFPQLDIGSVFHFLYYRGLEIPNEVILEYFAAIPATLPFEWGSGLFDFFRSGSGGSDIPTYFAVAEVTRGNYESSSNAMFIADAWAQFSWAGVWIFSLLAGFVIRTIDLYAFGQGKTEETACIIASCSFGVLTLLSTSLTTAFISGGLALIPPLSMLISGRGLTMMRRMRVAQQHLESES